MKQPMIFAVTIVIAGLLIAVSASGFSGSSPNASVQKPVSVTHVQNAVAGRTVQSARHVQPSLMPLADPVPVTTGAHPAVSSDLSSIVIIGFEQADNPNVWYTASPDAGQSWLDPAIGWMLPDTPSFPDTDSCNNGHFIAGLVPNPNDLSGSALYKISVSNPLDMSDTGWTNVYWDWSSVGDGFTNFRSVAVGGYNSPVPSENTWTYGAHSMVGDLGGTAGGPNQPFFSYQANEAGTAWIYNFNNVSGCQIAGEDIDQGTMYSYAVWNYLNPNTNDMDLYVYINNFGVWGEYAGYPIHPDVATLWINTTGNDTDFDVNSFNNHTMIVSQREGSIVCYYSSNALNTVSEVTIAATGTHPRIVGTGDKRATCTFIKDGSLYYTNTTDGGATWSTPGKVDGSANVPDERKALDICGLGAAWNDATGVFFGPLSILPPAPKLSVSISTGFGIGMKGTINNTGNAAATNLKWTVTIKGGILGKIDTTFNGTIASLAAGASTPLSTGMVFGLGTITLTLSAISDEGAAAGPTTKDGTQLIIFTIVK
jgi:hypothetical protein